MNITLPSAKISPRDSLAGAASSAANASAATSPNGTGTGNGIVARRLGRLRRQLVTAVLVGLGMLAAGSVAYLGGDAFYTSRLSDQSKLKSEIGTLGSQSAQVEQDAKEAKSAIELAAYLAPLLQTSDYSLNRDLLTQRVTQMRGVFFLDEVSVTASAIHDETTPGLTLSGGKEISMQVELDLTAASDAQIFQFTDALPAALPGYVDITSTSLIKNNELRPEVLLAIAQGAKTPVVKAKISFVWRGIRPTPAPESPATPGAPNAVPGAAPLPGPAAGPGPGAARALPVPGGVA